MKIFTCTTNITLRDFTDSVYPQGSFCFSSLLRGKDIKVNGVRTAKNILLKAGDEVIYYTNERQESVPSHTVIYEDGDICVADKFSGVSCEALCAELNGRGDFYAVHRLDRNTAGIICFAKTQAAEEQLKSAFANRGTEKIYEAVCKDNFSADSGILTAYAVKDPQAAKVKVYPRPAAGAKTMITEYKIKERKDGLALVEVKLHTGRTHQIRAHLAFIGCPVLGDEKYGDGELNKKYSAARQKLISRSLTFVALEGPLGARINGHPFTSPQILSF